VGVLQTTLFGTGPFALTPLATSVHRHSLEPGAWVDTADRWVQGADDLYAALVHKLDWRQGHRWIIDHHVIEPRLTAGVPEHGPIAQRLDAMGDALGEHYGRPFRAAWCNHYRNGDDSVAWHHDRLPVGIGHQTVALVSLGGPRTLRFRPAGGGRSRGFPLHSGDLLVVGDRTQHRHEHAVPKVASASPRISIVFRCPLPPSNEPPTGGFEGRSRAR